MARFVSAMILLCALAAPVGAQQVTAGSGAMLRILDKITGGVADVELDTGGTARQGRLSVTLAECRYPSGNRSGNAYALLTVIEAGTPDPVFRGWMIASAPALNAMEHPRYDVWVMRCKS